MEVPDTWGRSVSTTTRYYSALSRSSCVSGRELADGGTPILKGMPGRIRAKRARTYNHPSVTVVVCPSVRHVSARRRPQAKGRPEILICDARSPQIISCLESEVEREREMG